MTRSIRIAGPILAVLLLGIQAALSVRGLVNPSASAAAFGVPVDDPSAMLYQLVYRSRNLVLALTGLVFVWRGMWLPLAIMATVSIALPLFDIWVLRGAGLPVTAVHPATAVALVALSAALWARVATDKRPE